jgi:DNA repair exonuclease SbcCD ATPase subunit
MRIKEFSINRYGPLPRRGPYSLSNFNLFWGKNESGKTLMVEALIKMIFKKELRKLKDKFERIDRVKDGVEGEIVFIDEKGEEYEPERFLKKLNISISEFRNIFVVRNSDLSIEEDNKENYYYIVTEKLTGERISEIDGIIKNLRGLGKLTETGDISDHKTYGKVGSRLNNAKNLIEEIKRFKEDVKEKNLEESERRYFELEEEIHQYEMMKKNLEDAEKREKFEKGSSALMELKELLKKIEEIYPFNEEERDKWIRNEEEIKRGEEEIERLKGEVENSKKELKRMEREIYQLDERKKWWETMKKDIENYEKKRESKKIFLPLLIISVALACSSIVGFLLKPSLTFFILTLLFIISSLICGFFSYRLKKLEKLLSKKVKENLGIYIKNVEEIYFHFQIFENDYEKKKRDMEELKNRKLPSLEEKMGNLESKLKSCEEEIEKIKIKSGVSSFEEYKAKLQEKQKLNEMIKEREGSLTMLLGRKSNLLEENIPFWEEKIKELEEYKDRAKDLSPNEREKKELERKIEAMRKELEDRKNTLLDFQIKLGIIEEKTQKILQDPEPVRCKSIANLDEIQERLTKFIEENERNALNARKAIEIFEEIKREARGRLSELFGSKGPVSDYFKRITKGLYKEVEYEKNEIKVIKRDNTYVKAQDLSAGTYDQLYFSIRLALAEKILKGEKGFFILDDPFIKSDPDRLEELIEMLKEISESGWQILYFSAKKEIKDALQKYCEERNGYFEMREWEGS